MDSFAPVTRAAQKSLGWCEPREETEAAQLAWKPFVFQADDYSLAEGNKSENGNQYSS